TQRCTSDISHEDPGGAPIEIQKSQGRCSDESAGGQEPYPFEPCTDKRPTHSRGDALHPRDSINSVHEIECIGETHYPEDRQYGTTKVKVNAADARYEKLRPIPSCPDNNHGREGVRKESKASAHSSHIVDPTDKGDDCQPDDQGPMQSAGYHPGFKHKPAYSN